MRTSAAVAFCLLLGLVLLQAVSADKPGTCPPLTMACTVKTTNNCTKDIDCPENQKCCNRCGMKCTPPIPDLKLLSVCPAFDPEICSIVRPGKPECHNDGNCTGNRKCCCSKCGLRCVEPERVKPGRCSNILAKCNPTLMNNTCKTDMDCQGNQKCCKLCGMKCRDPMPEPAGFCPVNDAEEVLDFPCPSSKCSRDSDCAPDEKCCNSKDGQKCMKPVTVKPGKCPSMRPMCMPLHANTCVSDGECPGKLKCCNICGKPCSEPQPVIKPGTCPAAEPARNCGYDNRDQCHNDDDCGGNKKCCASSCSKECKEPAPKPGLCPVDKVFCPAMIDYKKDKCHHDSECPGAQKCCSGCGMQCVDPQKNKVKSGSCPKIIAKCKLPLSYNCTSDSDCLVDLKCCPLCGMKCLEPDHVPKNGLCPPFMPAGTVSHIACTKLNTTECTYDSDCGGRKKCCSQMCNNLCRDPVIVPKNGLCPPFMPAGTVSHIACTKLNTTECTYDSDCGGRKKCCSQMCNNVCRDPVIVPKNGLCPPFMPAGTVSHIACTKLNTTECTYDSDCGGRKKCCSQMCNNVCRDPVIVPKNGLCPPFMPAGTVSHIACTKLNTTECTYDSDCGGRKKCCSQMCNNVCRDPVIVPKNGLCPPFMPAGTVSHIACTKLNTTECTYDSDCGGRKKCCSQMCNNVCRDPVIAKPGCCPTGRLSCPRQPVTGFKDLCQNDFNCTGDMKCCNRCGRRCTAPDTTERSGSCPANIYMCPLQTGPPDNECECDNQCPPNKKCCSRCDGKKCVDPKAGSTVIKAGTCPVVNTFVACSLPLPQSCGCDSQCDGEQKCCKYGCEIRCTKPVN